MARTIRFGVFETNSSSVHTMTIVTEEQFNKWVDGKALYDRWEEELIFEGDEDFNPDDEDLYTYKSFSEYENDYSTIETFEKHITLEDGRKIVAFGFVGYDG